MEPRILSLISMLSILLVCVEGRDIYANRDYRTYDGRNLTFGTLHTFWYDYYGTLIDSPPQNLDTDLVYTDRILFSDEYHLHSVKDGNHNFVAGSSKGYENGPIREAMFGRITGFLQITKWRILVVDNYNHCIRLVDRWTSCVSDFVGKCTLNGNNDGVGDQALFNGPYGITQDDVEKLYVYVSDRGNNAIRRINTDTKSVTSISREFSSPGKLVWDKVGTNESSRSFLVVDGIKVKRFQLPNMNVSTIFDGNWGFSDVSLGGPKFWEITDIHTLHTAGVYVISDAQRSRLQLVDVKKKAVNTLCTGHSLGSYCEVSKSSGLYFLNNMLYVGVDGKVAALKVESIDVRNLSRANLLADDSSMRDRQCNTTSNNYWNTTTDESFSNHWSTSSQRPTENNSHHTNSSVGIGIVVGAVLGTAILIALVVVIILLSYKQCTKGNGSNGQMRYRTFEGNASTNNSQLQQNQGLGWASTEPSAVQVELQQSSANDVVDPTFPNKEVVQGTTQSPIDQPTTQSLPLNFTLTTSTVNQVEGVAGVAGQENSGPVFSAVCGVPDQTGYVTTGYYEEVGTEPRSDVYVLPQPQQGQYQSYTAAPGNQSTPFSS